MKKILIFLSLFFVLFSFFPSLFEIWESRKIPPERAFVLEHNYMFDYNFYLSRIRQGMEDRWLVVEKYYNQPHQESFFQIFYLLWGKVGGVFSLSPPMIYHMLRLLFGGILLITIAFYSQSIFSGRVAILAFLLVVTSSSWPIPIWFHGLPRFATHMGWWSVIDSLQRITFVPHLLFGQLAILVILWRYSHAFTLKKFAEPFLWAIFGLVAGIIFPPTLVVTYVSLVILTLLEIFNEFLSTARFFRSKNFTTYILTFVMARIIFILISLPSFFYLQVMFRVLPWSALALFDIEHRLTLPYDQYFLALGPILPLGLAGVAVAFKRGAKKLFPAVSWILAIFLLFWIFESIPTQSPLRFTQGAIHIPLAILTAYLFIQMSEFGKKLRGSGGKAFQFFTYLLPGTVVVLGIGVMLSMIAWLTDQVRWKREATYPVPIKAEVGYPLKDFMDGVYFIAKNTPKDSVVLSYVTAGNFIPAYAGNFVYIGHANTPKEDFKEKVAEDFFGGRFADSEARDFLIRERIDYIYFGPQEREWTKGRNLQTLYPFLQEIYRNSRVVIYKT